MGNANINLGGFGVDWNEQGGGATFFGMRIGGGPNGAEIGTNVGIGAQVNGSGAYAGAGAKATVGGDGVGGSAGVQANMINQEAGAAAGVQANYDSTASTYAVDTSASNVRMAGVVLKVYQAELVSCTQQRDNAQAAATKAQEELDDAKTDLENAKHEQQEAQTKLGNAGIAKTEVLNISTAIQMDNIKIKVELQQAQESLDEMTKLGKAAAELESVKAKIVQLQDKLVGLQKDCGATGIQKDKATINLDKAKQKFANANAILAQKDKALREKRRESTTKEDLLKAANGSVEDAKKKVETQQKEKDDKEKLYMEEKKKRETYQQAK